MRTKINGIDIDAQRVTISDDDDTYPDWMGWAVVVAGWGYAYLWYRSFLPQ